jgi:hypothetical protein
MAGRRHWVTLAVGLAAAAVVVASAAAGFHAGPGSPIAVGTGPGAAVTADFDLDGNPDLAVANRGSDDVTILYGDGNGGFPTSATLSVGSQPDAITTEDFNFDGYPDVAVANFGSDDATLWLGSAGGFTSSVTISVGDAPAGIAAADVNGDGFPDLAVTNSGDNTVSFLLGDGVGGLSTGGTVPTGAGPTCIAPGDLNGDTFTDLAVCDSSADKVTILLNDGTGTFTPSTVDVTTPLSIATGYLDADANLDLAVADGDDNLVQVLFGDGTGAFPSSRTVATDAHPVSVAAADLNGDGLTDLATANHDADDVTVAFGDGLGGFTEASFSPVASGSRTSSVVAGDWNGDLFGDLAATASTDDDVWVFLNSATDADLADLTTTAGPLSPTFDPATTSYDAGPVPSSTSSVTVTPTADSPDATIEVRVNGGSFSTVTSGSASGPLALDPGTNTIDVRVTAEDGTTQKTYTITVRRSGSSSNARLSALSTTAGPLTKPFSPNTTSYKVKACVTSSTVTVSATAADPDATLQFRANGGSYSTPVASPATSAPLSLKNGKNVLQVRVNASNGKNVKTYSIAVTGCASSTSTADLSALTTTAGALQPSFSSSRLTYTAGPVSNSTTSVTVTPTAADPGATIQVRVNGGSFATVASGSASGPLALNVGTNTIDVKVTNGSAAKSYTITVKRKSGETINGSFACDGTFTGLTVNGNVTVGNGDTCTLSGGTVYGPVQVGAGGGFAGSGGLTIYGGVQAANALWVTLDHVNVPSSVAFTGLTGTPPGADQSSICHSTIGGGILLMGNAAEISVGDAPPCSGGNTVIGGIQAQNNTALVRISDNSITGPLLCLGNTPAPTGSGNTATVKIGQCASM